VVLALIIHREAWTSSTHSMRIGRRGMLLRCEEEPPVVGPGVL
jgi:hypothetical protein